MILMLHQFRPAKVTVALLAGIMLLAFSACTTNEPLSG